MTSKEVQYIGQLGIDWGNAAYVDCGILFPFFYKNVDSQFSVHRWLNDICAICSNHSIYTTAQVWREVDRAYHLIPLPKREKTAIRTLFKKVADKVLIDRSYKGHDKDPRLSIPDISLLNRADQSAVVVTADKYIHWRDENSILLVWDTDRQSLSVSKGAD